MHFSNTIPTRLTIAVSCLPPISKDCFCLLSKLNEDCTLPILLVGLTKTFTIKSLPLEIHQELKKIN